MRDTSLLGRLQQAARAFEIDLPVAFSGEMDYHIHALDGLSQTLSGYQISLLPLRARPILTRAGPPTHPTHGIPRRAQLLHYQAAQFSRAAGYENLLHVRILSCFSLFCMPLFQRFAQETREHGQNVTLLSGCFLSCCGPIINKEEGER